MATSQKHPSLGLARGTTVLRDYDDRWPGEFMSEAEALRSILGELVVAIEHIGSTAVPGLAAKPVIDIAIAFSGPAATAEAARRLHAAGYEGGEDMGDDGGIIFAKGLESRRTHILHLVEAGTDQWHRWLAFRDALRADEARRRAYVALKRDLAARFPLDRPSYVGAKAAFIRATIAARPPTPS
jgi:GrpB-like predicted nucleotidyltransferase (UPF0157 family)